MIGLYSATSFEVIVHFAVGKPSLRRVPKYIDIWLWPWQCCLDTAGAVDIFFSKKIYFIITPFDHYYST
jgi:hypothetical protein